MAFNITPNVTVERDKAGVVRHLGHLQQPYTPLPGSAPSPRVLAGEYLRDVAPHGVPSQGKSSRTGWSRRALLNLLGIFTSLDTCPILNAASIHLLAAARPSHAVVLSRYPQSGS
jgi:hypothetical protein